MGRPPNLGRIPCAVDRTGHPPSPETGGHRYAAMDASASASPVALLSCVMDDRPSTVTPTAEPLTNLQNLGFCDRRRAIGARVAVSPCPTNIAISVRGGPVCDSIPAVTARGGAAVKTKKISKTPFDIRGTTDSDGFRYGQRDHIRCRSTKTQALSSYRVRNKT